MADTWNILRVLTWIVERFAKADLRSARLDAEVLLAHALAIERIRLYMDHDKPLAAPELTRVRDSVRRRLAGEPVAYITGAREFWSLPFTVSRAVLVPRPETEILVELALELIRRRQWGPPSPIIVDVGTGSGAIAVACGRELPGATIVGVDRDAAALEVARQNAASLGVELALLEGDLLAPLAPDLRPDLVVSNPPYVASGDLSRLAPEVRDWEPRQALDGGVDGLEVIRRLVPQAIARLAPGGWLALEVGEGQASAVRALLEAQGLVDPVVRRDLAGVERAVAGRRA
jgi:release factor glutamine methyltransferase